ncbi:MAG: hypothetical protein ACRD8A_08350 [Candidatus Acidiferrales bacterium]
MKTANSFATWAVLGLAACLAPAVSAQANPPQKQAQAHPASVQQNHPVSRAPVAHPASPAVKHVDIKRAGVKHAEVKHAELKHNASRPGTAVKHAALKPNLARPLTSSHRAKAPLTAQTIRKPETRKPVRTPVTHKPVHAATAVAHKPAVPKPVAAPVAQAPAVAVEPVISRRDPFAPLIEVSAGGKTTGEHLPPGVGGLVVATVRVAGTVEAPSGMLAVVSNPDDRIYFVRVGDRLYDGDVEKISLDGVTFKENSKDAFGKPVERLVTKRIYPNAGE